VPERTRGAARELAEPWRRRLYREHRAWGAGRSREPQRRGSRRHGVATDVEGQVTPGMQPAAAAGGGVGEQGPACKRRRQVGRLGNEAAWVNLVALCVWTAGSQGLE
jgi:hypothetical protein